MRVTVRSMTGPLCAALLTLSLSGCGFINNFLAGTDNTEPPTPLAPIESMVRADLVWRTDLGKGPEEKALGVVPAVAGERVFAADPRGGIYALELNSGREIWRVQLEKGQVVTAGPGVGQERVVVGTQDGEVMAYSADDGSLLWTTRVTSEVLSVPQPAADIVAVRTVDGRLTGLSAQSGEKLWAYDRETPLLTLRGTSAPAFADNNVIVGFDGGRVAAVSARDGRAVWERNVAVPRGRSELERLVDIDADPLVRDETVYVTSFQGQIAALNAASGRVGWSREMSSYAGLDVDTGRVYVSDDQSQIWALDRYTGASYWKQDKLKFRRVTAPRVLGDYIVVGDLEGYLHWMAVDDGRLLGRTRTNAKGFAAPPLVVGDEMLLLQGRNGGLSAYRVADRES